MAKKAHIIISKEALRDVCFPSLPDVKVDGVSLRSDGQIIVELSGDGLPVDDGTTNEQIKMQHGPDTTKPYYRMKTKLAKQRDSF